MKRLICLAFALSLVPTSARAKDCGPRTVPRTVPTDRAAETGARPRLPAPTAEYVTCALSVERLLAKAKPPEQSLARFVDYRKNGEKRVFVDNPDFWAREVDFSCEAIWKTDCGPGNRWNMFGATAISPRHVLFSRHAAPKNGIELLFRSADGEVVMRKLVGQRTVTGDLAVGALDEDLPPAIRPAVIPSPDVTHQFGTIRALPVVTLNQLEEAIVSDLACLMQLEDTGIEAVAVKPASPRRARFYKKVVAGDSSNPRFLIAGNRAILISLMWHGEGGSGTYIPLFAPLIRDAMDELRPGYVLREVTFRRARE